MRAAVLLAGLLAAAPAHASVWDRALGTPETEQAAVDYDSEMRQGDEHVGEADMAGTSISERKRQLKVAIDSYHRAATAHPDAADPYFRIAEALNSFYFEACEDSQYHLTKQSPLRDCTAGYGYINRPAAEQYLDALAEAEKRAPLDPRFSAGTGSLLFQRALVHTRLATPEHWKLAAEEYREYLERADPLPSVVDTPWSNLAETYMMLGQLDESIDAYREALRASGGDVSSFYGYAVALDRAGRGTKALEVMHDQGQQQFDLFVRRVNIGDSFYVPEGEQFYYLALATEAFDRFDESETLWKVFIASHAQPQYEARAQEHIDALAKKLGRTP